MIKISSNVSIIVGLIKLSALTAFFCTSCTSANTNEVEEETVLITDSVIAVEVAKAEVKQQKKEPYKQLFDSILCDGFCFPVINDDTDLFTDSYVESYSAANSELLYWNCRRIDGEKVLKNAVSIGKGIVEEVIDTLENGQHELVIMHQYYENGGIDTIYSIYSNLDSIYVKFGDSVSKEMPVGQFGEAPFNPLLFKLQTIFEYKGIAPDSIYNKLYELVPVTKSHHIQEFIHSHQQIKSPINDSLLLVAVKHDYTLHIFKYGDSITSMPIALGQLPIGHKVEQGDNRTPEGEYFISEKLRGPFGGMWGEYIGPVWMRVSYPNSFDAIQGYRSGLITIQEMQKIQKADTLRKMSPKNTNLGGGIGIHGWAGEWNESYGNDLTWGCISINNHRLPEFYKQTPRTTKIIILP